MARRKQTSLIGDFLDSLLELVDIWWEAGAVMTVLFLCGGLYGLIGAMYYQPPSVLIASLLVQFPFVPYLFPIICLTCAFIFGVETYRSYKRQNFY